MVLTKVVRLPNILITKSFLLVCCCYLLLVLHPNFVLPTSTAKYSSHPQGSPAIFPRLLHSFCYYLYCVTLSFLKSWLCLTRKLSNRKHRQEKIESNSKIDSHTKGGNYLSSSTTVAESPPLSFSLGLVPAFSMFWLRMAKNLICLEE